MDSTLSSSPTIRLPQVDLLRGIAIGGMLVVNLYVFTGVNGIPLYHQYGADWFSSFLVLFLFEGKFYPIFGFLFGWGIAQRKKFILQSSGIFTHNYQRLAFLGLIGLAHGCFLWQGDILIFYALLGIFLSMLRRIPLRALKLLLLISLIIPIIFYLPGFGREIGQGYAWLISPISIPLTRIQNDPESSTVIHRSIEYAEKILFFPIWGGTIAASVLAGFLTAYTSSRTQIRLRLILIPGLMLNLCYAFITAFPNLVSPTWNAFLRSIGLLVGGPMLSLAYGLTIICLAQKPVIPILRECLIRAGRMPLTLYLMQSLVGALFLKLRFIFMPHQIWYLATGIFVLQLGFAYLWHQYFQRGPIEFAWRWLSSISTSTST